MSQCHKQTLEQRSHAEIKHSEWQLQVTWLFLTNQSALFQHSKSAQF